VGIILAKNREVATWQGVHLFHFGLSNCSQRVRMMLEEKNIAWQSHYVDIPRNENLTDWYQDINPKAVVPTLVHDGVVVVESNDILRYLNTEFDGANLLQGTGIDERVVQKLIAMAEGFQGEVKVLTHEYLFKPVAKKSAKNLQLMERKIRNKSLLKFHQNFSRQGFSQEQLNDAVKSAHDVLGELDQQLMTKSWLAGSDFSIADICWIVNIHRLDLMRFPVQRYPNVTRWFAMMKRRPSYTRALVAYEPGAVRGFLKIFTALRSLFMPKIFDYSES
tara:strand:+ start:227 stop:1057 length:831 start_codon:yes stop_codon:yes gene_type:complete